jgi:hydrogenase maturation protein HypF
MSKTPGPASAAHRPPVLVLGIGNILLRDEGVGVRVIEAMAGKDLPPEIELVDGGTAGADLIDLIADRRKVVVIDAVQAHAEPGTLFRFTPADLVPTEVHAVSLHQVGLLESLSMARQLGVAPQEVVVFAVEPKEVRPGLELTPEIAALVPKIVELVLKETSDQQSALSGQPLPDARRLTPDARRLTPDAPRPTPVLRCRFDVTGRVQGVGFRPYVYRLATELALTGTVANDPRGVTIEVQGPAEAVEAFARRLPAELPPLARIDSLPREERSVVEESAFVVLPSATDAAKTASVTPDFAVCDDCLREMADPADRRFHYPFINCTNCGPRYTIIFDIPYDRRSTTMAGFRMCADCSAEYHDPASRRFHAQPNACPLCGPRLEKRCQEPFPEKVPDTSFVEQAANVLHEGKIVAVKGLGGFHLACVATDEAAVQRLRERKHREAKPLAVMVASLDDARRCALVSDIEAQALTSVERPIVLVRKRADTPIAPAVAPASPYLGLMLPYTPLHVLLLTAAGAPLVMTSGNVSDDPICRTNAEADERLGTIADLILAHNRPIYTACDDSVVRADLGRVRMLRRSRGYVPERIELPIASPAPLLAVGPELKNTVCLAAGRSAVLSHHIGDLKNDRTESFFRHAIESLGRTMDIRPHVVAHDLHPAYLSTRYAAGLGLRRIAVQHHHAHVAACMAEHGLAGQVIGLSCDGTGYGADGTTWGCEFLVADEREFRRAGRLANVPLPGGDRAAEEPWRMGLSYLDVTVGADAESVADELLADIDVSRRRVVLQMVRRGVNSPPASSLGRLFDAASALAGVCLVHRYEAQAAIELEAAIDPDETGAYPWSIRAEQEDFVVDPAEIIRGIVADRRAGVAAGAIAARFHRAVAGFLVAAARRLRDETGLGRVVLSGGSFQNAFLLRAVHDDLARAGFAVYAHERVPANDGGLALGQAYIAAARLARPSFSPAPRSGQRGSPTA